MQPAQDWHVSFLARGFFFPATLPPLHGSAPVAIPTETRQEMLITKATATQDTGPEAELTTCQIK